MGRKQCAVLTAALLAVGLAAVPATAAAELNPGTAADRPGTVTLITGDLVRVAGERVAGVRMAKGREHVHVWRYTLNGHDFVVPDDAMSQVNAGKLDKRLFDVTGLVQQGYDDAREPSVPTIITGTTAGRLATNGIQAVDVPKKDAASAWKQQRRGDQKVWLNGKVHATLDQSVKQVGAPEAWQQGFKADGVKVAVLDTGYDANHPDLKSKVDVAENFTDEDNRDNVGHGTHVASTIAGTGAASNGRYAGVAPGARLLIGKVLGQYGGREDWIINGMQWAVDNGAKVVNMSLGGGVSDGTDLMSQVVNELSEKALFVIAAGNSGAPETVGSPGSADRALTVANVTKSDELSVTSSQGPRVGDFGLKPEISAPGTDIVAARAEGTYVPFSINENYTKISGTSMATPHVAGAAAILAGQHPQWTGGQLKSALISSAKRLPGIDTFAQGAGRLDIARGVKQQVRAEGVLSFGNLWGKQDANRTITYVNDGPNPVQLTLTVDVKQKHGGPTNLFTTDKTVAVPAKGTAQVTVKADATDKPNGEFEGVVRAQAGELVLTTPLTANLKGAKNTLTIKVPSRDGEPYRALVTVQNDETGYADGIVTDTGEATFEVPSGKYRALGMIVDQSFTRTMFALPVQVSGDTEFTVDTKKGKKVTVGIDDPDAKAEAGGGIGILSDVDETGPRLGTAVLAGGAQENLYTLGGHRMRGLSLASSSYWTYPWATIKANGPQGFGFRVAYAPFDLDFTGDLTARVVDVGEADTESINKAGDVTGAIAIITPNDWNAPMYPPESQLRSGIELLKAKGARAVVSYFNPAIEDQSPPAMNTILAFDQADLMRVQDQLKQGPVELTINARPNSPVAYFLADSVQGVPTGHDFRFRKAELGRIDRQFNDTLPKGTYRFQIGVLTAGGISGNAEVEVKWPQRRTDFISPGAQLLLYSAAGFWDKGDFGGEIALPVQLKPGQRHSTKMFAAPLGPELTQAPISRQDGKPVPSAYRLGDKINLAIPMFADSDPGNAAQLDDTNLGSTVLLKDGKEIGRRNDRPALGEFVVPAGPGRFQLIADANRPQYELLAPQLSPKTRSEWTFRAGAGTDQRTALPLLDVRFDLPLDEHNTTAAGKPLSGKVTAAHQPGARPSWVVETSVEISFDEGKTWQRAKVRGDRVELPAGPAGYASLKATARDIDGNSVTETVIRAYAIK
ncbi:S8 family serine peptidase [Kibdelosporangium philippinense]|uniref:S8 family serine peptidase n=1 Tax=Kibdelosporangium philippinense TaxID=211113 RepID=A0ABS8ZF20_9PSEU|nr:S8 family serine peptidase [Kibdelosporangium philippinense]MCE7005874.1 S8 family serine peptidase [Kibdelosporangium philippinense]